MSRFVTVFALLLLLALTSQATIRIVDNSPLAAATSYTTLQAAHDDATNGDTLYVIGTGISYGNLASTKSLLWFGPGYFLQYNLEQQANLSPARCGSITFNAGSGGSLFTSMQVEFDISVNTGNILIKRCYIWKDDVDYLISINASNVILEQCYIVHMRYYGDRWTIFCNDAAHNITIRNCYIRSNCIGVSGTTSSGPVEVSNCVISCSTLRSYNAQYTNNILQSGTFYINNNGYFYNIGNGDQWGTANGNQININMNLVFVGGSSPDASCQLSATSPARGVGQGGTDCGMYGGQWPYVLSGVPNLPTITYFSAPTTGSTVNGIPITFRARGRN